MVGGINICDDRLTSQGQALGAPRWDLAIVATGHIVDSSLITFSPSNQAAIKKLDSD